MIVTTLIIIVIFGVIKVKDAGNNFESVEFLNKDSFTQSIGFSVYAFEGIGLIIPV
jgi:hypothetical protein